MSLNHLWKNTILSNFDAFHQDPCATKQSLEFTFLLFDICWICMFSLNISHTFIFSFMYFDTLCQEPYFENAHFYRLVIKLICFWFLYSDYSPYILVFSFRYFDTSHKGSLLTQSNLENAHFHCLVMKLISVWFVYFFSDKERGQKKLTFLVVYYY